MSINQVAPAANPSSPHTPPQTGRTQHTFMQMLRIGSRVTEAAEQTTRDQLPQNFRSERRVNRAIEVLARDPVRRILLNEFNAAANRGSSMGCNPNRYRHFDGRPPGSGAAPILV